MSTVVTSRTNSRVKQLRAAFGGQRLAEGLVAIEGEHLLYEAVRSGLSLKTIFVREDQCIPHWLPENIPLVELSHDVFASAVHTQNPQGLAALIDPPRWSLDDTFPQNTTPLLLIAVGLQDPGNLGTLIRSAEAFGATGVLTTPGTVSPWNQKALRASAGSAFRMPIVAMMRTDLASLRSRHIRIFAAAAEQATSRTRAPNCLAAGDADLTQPSALMIGNEGAGLGADLLHFADALISIPMPGPVESLNAAVAGSLLLYEAACQRAGKASNPDLK